MKNGSLLWSITDVRSRQISYLFGTMHVKDERAFHWIDQLTELIQNCDSYAGESHIDDLSTISHLQSFQNDMGLSNLMPPKKYDRLRKSISKSFGVDIIKCEKLFPMLVTNMLAEGLLYQSHSISLDAALWGIAKKYNKVLIGIESAEKQMQIFHKIPIEDQVGSLLKIGRNPISFKKQVLKTVNQYQNQETQQLYKSSKKSLGSLRKLLLYDRNIEMARVVHNQAHSDTTFFAVGAAHLFGNKGMLKYLKGYGNILSPIRLVMN